MFESKEPARDSGGDCESYLLRPGRSRHPRAFKKEENLWRRDLQRIGRRLREHWKAVVEYKRRLEKYGPPGPLDDERPLLSIAVFGPSGSGKSSLLRTLVAHLRSKDGLEFGDFVDDSNSTGKVTSLQVMEPSIWSQKDHFLYSFLASALEEDRLLLQRKQDDGTIPPQGLSPVQIAFQNVNEYLRVIDESDAGGEYDPLGTSLQRLERHTSGLRLREQLEQFIVHLAQELSMQDSVILLPVDDIDMAPDHMVDALQAYQSYLLHPQLVPVFTFTDRMPEELLRVHFERQLSVPEGATTSRSTMLEQMNKRLEISEQLAVQFLARCFPVRNRIRLGPAPGRVQRADLGSGRRERGLEGSGKREKVEVSALLVTSSFLLFGHPDREAQHPVKAALRPSTLRRQIQTVDAMADLKLDSFVTRQFLELALIPRNRWPNAVREQEWDLGNGKGSGGGEGGNDGKELIRVSALEVSEKNGKKSQLDRKYDKLDQRLKSMDVHADYSWGRIFRVASWSLLNVHRDTLRELNLHLEDLYSWSPRELRSVILDTVLQQNRATRRLILDRWINRADFRRSQVLSLLAANAFRPWMTGDEPHGDEMAPIRYQRRLESQDAEISEKYSFPAAKGLLWFVDVTVGFYLPQVLTRNWADATSREMKVKERLSGNGWDLHLGPVNAAKAADYKKTLLTWGMMFLSPGSYAAALNPRDAEYENLAECSEAGIRMDCLLLRIWSVYGYSRGRFWAAISLWRGLGLIGQILEIGTQFQESLKIRPVDQIADEAKIKDLIEGVLRAHCLASMVPGSLLTRGAREASVRVMFPRWTKEDFADEIKYLRDELYQWLLRIFSRELELHLMPAPETEITWGECFLRHVHGEGILGSLWPHMNAEYLQHDARLKVGSGADKDPHVELAKKRFDGLPEDWRPGDRAEDDAGNHPWNAAVALEVWIETLLDYWRGCRPILDALLSCPLILVSAELSTVLETRAKWREWLPDEVANKNGLRSLLERGQRSRSLDVDAEKAPKKLRDWLDGKRVPVAIDSLQDIRPPGIGEPHRRPRAKEFGAAFAIRRALISEFDLEDEPRKVDARLAFSGPLEVEGTPGAETSAEIRGKEE